METQIPIMSKLHKYKTNLKKCCLMYTYECVCVCLGGGGGKLGGTVVNIITMTS